MAQNTFSTIILKDYYGELKKILACEKLPISIAFFSPRMLKFEVNDLHVLCPLATERKNENIEIDSQFAIHPNSLATFSSSSQSLSLCLPYLLRCLRSDLHEDPILDQDQVDHASHKHYIQQLHRRCLPCRHG